MKLSDHSIGGEWTIEILKVMYQTGKKNADSLGVKEEPYWGFVEVDNFICPILYNQINLGNSVFHNLLDYSNEYIEKISVDEDKACNFLLTIDPSIDEKVNLRDEFDVSDERKEFNSLKNIRKNDKLQIAHILENILNRDLRIDELSKKREIFSNDVSKIKRYKYNLKEILKNGRKIRNRAEFDLEY